MQYELTGKTRTTDSGELVEQIRALEDSGRAGVKVGDTGGWLAPTAYLCDNAWIGDDAVVCGRAVLSGNAYVYGKAYVGGSAHVYGNVKVGGNAHVSDSVRLLDHASVHGYSVVRGNASVLEYGSVSDNAVISENSRVRGRARVSGNAFLTGNAYVSGNEAIKGNASVYERAHVVSIGPVGSEGATVTIFRSDGGGHRVNIGCWDGTLSELMPEVARRRASADAWVRASKREADQWEAEYRAIVALGRVVVGRWS